MTLHLQNNYVSLIVLCAIVILSHLYESISKAIRVPTVLILLATGFLLRLATQYFNLAINLERYIPFFGIVGLIMIVLEGTIDIKLESRNRALIVKGFLAALATLLFSTAAIGYIYYLLGQRDPQTILVNAVPLAVISSAIAIPTVRHLQSSKKEFIIYESTFSDILGIMLFNLLLQKSWTVQHVITFSLVNSLGVVFISLLCSLGLLILVRRIKSPAKFSFILSIMIFLYAIGKLFHISVLFLVFLFGILLNNSKFYVHHMILKPLQLHGIDKEMEQFKPVVGEGAFLIRTFFFVLFGFTINPASLFQGDTVIVGMFIVFGIVAIRYLYFRILHKRDIVPEIFIAPRGLVTVLLFYSIPLGSHINCLTQGVVLFVILATNLIMMAGIMATKSETLPA